MKVVITGGGGFLGAWILRRLLDEGHEVRVFDRVADRRIVRDLIGPRADTIDWRVGDVSKLDDIVAATEGWDTTIHLAGLLTPACKADPIRGAHVNLIGTINVFEAAKRHGQRRVAYASSAGVFGPDDGAHPYPLTHYGAFKLACEGCARAYWLDDGIASVGFRPLVVYGPGREVGSSAGPTLACEAAVKALPFTIAFTGTTNMIFVDDVAAAFVAAVLRPIEGAHALNLRGEVTTVDRIIDEIRRIERNAKLSAAGPPLPITPDITEHDVEAVLGALPHTSLRQGLEQTLAFYRRTAAAT